jgi:hypothetical protein
MIRRTAIGWCVVLAAAVVAADPPKTEALGKAADLLARTKDAEKAKKLDEAKTRYAEFTGTLQGIGGQFSEFTPENGAKPTVFHKVILNADGKRVDAIRFKTPAGKANCDLTWEFVYPKDGGLNGWGIIAREGTVDGFKTFATKTNFAEKGVDLPKENKQVSQKLTGGKLKPETEYLIWFAFDGDNPTDVHIRMALTPVK